MKINKSSRHSKITGDFAERLVLYWLSKHGFECAFVDHVGVDIIARNPSIKNPQLMGISVKSRSRNTGTEGTYVSVPHDNLVKLQAACKVFGCVPYFAIVVDEAGAIIAFILSQDHLEQICPLGKAVHSWKMTEKAIVQYERDPEIKTFRFITRTGNWWA